MRSLFKYLNALAMRSHLFKNKYRASSTRLPHQDYRTPGGYFVTICTNNWVTFFGDVVDVTMQLSKIWQIADRFWREIPDHFESVCIDEYVVTPNHIHGIIVIERYRDYDPPVDNGYFPTDSGVATDDGYPPFDDVAIPIMAAPAPTMTSSPTTIIPPPIIASLPTTIIPPLMAV